MIEMINHHEQDSSLEINHMETRDAHYEEIESGLYTALQRYSNVHKGAGQYSRVTSALYEKAPEVILEYLGLSRNEYTWTVGDDVEEAQDR